MKSNNKWSGVLLSSSGVVLGFVGFGLLMLGYENIAKLIIALGFIITVSGLIWHFIIIGKQKSYVSKDKTDFESKPWD